MIVIRCDNNCNLCIRIDQKSCFKEVIVAHLQWEMCDILKACDMTLIVLHCNPYGQGLFHLLMHLIIDIRNIFIERGTYLRT